MVSWRTVTGKIEILDPQITSAAKIQEFFATERLLGRGGFQHCENAETDTDSQIFQFELAMAGRRRRVATLDEEGEIILGHTTNEVLESLSLQLGKISVELDQKKIHSPLDIGAVGVDEADLLVADLPAEDASRLVAANSLTTNSADASNNATTEDPGADAEDSATATDEPPITGAEAPKLATGPTLMLGEFPLSELPLMAKNENAKLLNFKLGSLQAVAAEDSFKYTRRIFPRSELVIVLSLGKRDFITPTLVVLRNSRRSVWEWQGELPPFDWFKDSQTGMNFVRDELGAGAIARAAVADIVDASFDEVRAALLADPQIGARKLAEILGVPAQVLSFLAGDIDIEAACKLIPDSHIFAPSSKHETFRQTIAWEVAGEGVVDADVAGAYRWMYLKRPWLVSLVAAGQAAIGGALISAAFLGKSRSKIAAGIGGALVVNAASRILTTGYVQSAIDHSGLLQQTNALQNAHVHHYADSSEKTN